MRSGNQPLALSAAKGKHLATLLGWQPEMLRSRSA